MKRFDSWVYETAPCLKDSPYRDAACGLVDAALQLGDGAEAWLLKTCCAYAVFHLKRELEECQDDPIPRLIEGLERIAEMLEKADPAMPRMKYALPVQELPDDLARATASHYANLFTAFTSDRYHDEPVKLLKDRLERNGYPIEKFPDMDALDIGCGNGRYTLALRRLGFKSVVGLDFAPLNIQDAIRRLRDSDVTQVRYVVASALDLPFRSGSYGFVFHNGVLHHTPDMAGGVREMLRVLGGGGRIPPYHAQPGGPPLGSR